MLKNKGDQYKAMEWLLIDSIAPVIGVVSTFYFSLPAPTLGFVLAVFTGFLFYICATDLLPASQGENSGKNTFVAVAGFVVIYVAMKYSNG